MRPVRIAMILPGLGRVHRGAEIAFLEIARCLQRVPDFQVELFGSGRETTMGESERTLPIRVTKCRPRESFERWPRFPCFRSECHYEEFSYVTRLWHSGAFQPDQYDVTISCTFPWVNWFLRWSKRKNPDLCNVFVTQNGDWMCHTDRREYRYFNCDGLVAINPDHFENNKDTFRTVLIPNGTDTERFFPRENDSVRPAYSQGVDVPPTATVVLIASALVKSKQVQQGIQAAAAVENVHLVIAGEGPERRRLEELAGRLLPERCHFLGSVAAGRMPDVYRHADVFLHLSRAEPFGIVYLEAAASGLPIVAHDGPATRWILGDSAIFVDSREVNSVANGLRTARDPAIRRRLADAGRQRIADAWTWQAQADKYRDFILALTAQSLTSRDTNDAFDHYRELQHA